MTTAGDERPSPALPAYGKGSPASRCHRPLPREATGPNEPRPLRELFNRLVAQLSPT